MSVEFGFWGVGILMALLVLRVPIGRRGRAAQ